IARLFAFHDMAKIAREIDLEDLCDPCAAPAVLIPAQHRAAIIPDAVDKQCTEEKHTHHQTSRREPTSLEPQCNQHPQTQVNAIRAAAMEQNAIQVERQSEQNDN